MRRAVDHLNRHGCVVISDLLKRFFWLKAGPEEICFQTCQGE